MDSRTRKQRILDALEKLPPDATYEDAMETIAFLARIEQGSAELRAGESIPHEEVLRRFRT